MHEMTRAWIRTCAICVRNEQKDVEENVMENKPAAGAGCHSNVGSEGQLSSSVTPRFRALQIRDTSEIVVVMVRSWKGDVLSGRKRARPCQG